MSCVLVGVFFPLQNYLFVHINAEAVHINAVAVGFQRPLSEF